MPDLIYIQTNHCHSGQREFTFEGSIGNPAMRGFLEVPHENDPGIKLLIPVSDIATGIIIQEIERFGISRHESRVLSRDAMEAKMRPLKEECQNDGDILYPKIKNAGTKKDAGAKTTPSITSSNKGFIGNF